MEASPLAFFRKVLQNQITNATAEARDWTFVRVIRTSEP
jgi:hypothetical protein